MARHLFKKGQSGNPKGKPKGAISAKTQAWEILGKYFVEEGAERLKEILDKSSDKEYLNYYIALLNYFKPRLSSTNINANVKGEIKQTVIEWEPAKKSE